MVENQWSLRTHLSALAQAGRLVHVGKPADPDTEVSALMAELSNRRAAGLFEAVGDSPHPLAYNMLADRDMVALALDSLPEEIADRMRAAIERPIAPETSTHSARSQEHVWEGEAADLGVLPTITHSELDAGRYITAGMVLTRDPETDRRNVSFNRICPTGQHSAGIRMMPPQQLGLIQAKAEARGENLPVAICVGMHPTAAIGGAASPSLGYDELGIVGGLRGQPVPMVPGITIPIDVPEEAEFVIEGWIESGVREPEGPFGDFLEYYVPQMPNHRLRVTAITHRTDAIFQTMHAGSREDVQILGLSRETQVLQAVRGTGATVTGVRLKPTILGAVIAIEPRFDGEAKSVAMAALAAYRWLKYVVVVDSDVNIDDPEDAWWAIATRTAFERDTVVIPHAGGFPRDESGMHNARLIIDATAPLGREEQFLRRVPPGRGTVRLDDFTTEPRSPAHNRGGLA